MRWEERGKQKGERGRGKLTMHGGMKGRTDLQPVVQREKGVLLGVGERGGAQGLQLGRHMAK